ncbi:MAG: NUDIX hydrolase [Candidatus Brocadiia bacterium]
MSDAPVKVYVTTDAVTFALSPTGPLELLLIRRRNPPYQGRWALPGGFVDEDEDLPDACARELLEEAGLRPAALAQIGAWGTPGRDPRGRNVSVAYLAVVRPSERSARAGDDAAEARWFPVGDLPKTAFDHADIVAAGLEKLRLLALSTHVAFALLPEEFRLDDLRCALEAVRGGPVTFDQAAAVAECARLEVVSEGEGDVGNVYRCNVGDYLAPLGR